MPSGGRLTGLVALVVVLVSFAGACAGATDQRASGGASARTGAATGEPGASSVTATSPGPSGGGPSASASNVTECGAPDYPCDWADVPDATIDLTQRLTDEARARVVAGGSFADVAAWLQSQPGVATVESDDHAVRFRPVGGRAVWVVDEATFRGPAAARDSDFRLASVRIPVAGPPTDPDALVGGDIEDKQALVLSPYFWNFDPNDSAPSATAALQATRGYAGHVTQILNAKKGDQTVGLDAFEHWDQYDVVFVSSHGARICGAERCRAVIAAGELGAGQPISWFQRRSLRGTGIELMTDGSGTFTMLLDADFFRNWYPNGLDETLVIIDACETLGPKVSDIADVLRGSTSEYLGWTETVNAAISTTATSTLLKSMATGLTVRQAYRRLGSLKDDPGSGAQLSIVGPAAGDLRTREIVSFRDASGATTLAPGAKIPITGTPGDGQPDRVPWHVLVEGLDAEEAGATPLHVTIAGSTANPVTVADGKQVKPDVWLVDGEVPLTMDLAVGAPVSMRASVDLVDTGTSTVELGAVVAEAKHATDCKSLLPRADVLAAVGVDIGKVTVPGEESAQGVGCVWEDVGWELLGQGKKRPSPPALGQLGGTPCGRSGQVGQTVYCLNEEKGVVGGMVFTSRWAFILGTAGISMDQVVSGIIPILDRTAN